MEKVYWTDENGVKRELLRDRRGDYYYEDGDWDCYLDDEDLIALGLIEEDEEPERKLSEEELWEIEGDKRYHEYVDKLMCGELR